MSPIAGPTDSAAPVSMPQFPIAPWERYMALDHGPNHSMTCHSRFWFQGNLDRQDFIQALEKLAPSNPFMALEWTNQHWQQVPFDTVSQIDWQDASIPIPLTHLPPYAMRMQFIVRVGTLGQLDASLEGDRDALGALLVIKYSHSISDGKGILSLITQLQRFWAGTLESSPPTGDLNYRLHFGLTRMQRWKRLPRDLRRIGKFLRIFPTAFHGRTEATTPPVVNGGNSQPDIAVIRRVSTTERMGNLRNIAHAHYVRVNDLLIALLFRTMAEAQNCNHSLRIAIPISMRPEHEESVCNLVSMVFLDRRPTDVQTPRFLSKIAKEMEEIKSHHLGHAMIFFLTCASLGKGWFLKHFLRIMPNHVTTVLTNLGRPFPDQQGMHIGPWTLLSTDTIPPLRPGTNIVFSVNRFEERLSVTCRFDPRFIDATLAENLVDRFLTADELPFPWSPSHGTT